MRAMNICEGYCLPSLRELFRGVSFCGLDMMTDMSRVARIVHRRYNWLAKTDPMFARALGWTKAMADQPAIVELPLLEAAVRRVLGRFDKISWPTGMPHPRLLSGLRNLHLRIRFYQACTRDRQAQLEIAGKTFELISATNSPQENKSLLTMSLGWLTVESNLSGYILGADETLHSGLVGVQGEMLASRLSAALGPDGMADLFRLKLAGLLEDGESAPKGARRFQAAKLGGGDAPKPADSPVDSLVTGPSLVVFPKVGKTDDDRGRAAERSVEKFVGKAMPLAVCDDMQAVRRALLKDFPQAASIIDTLLSDVAVTRDGQGRGYIHFPPTVLIGQPGGGKSSFAMALGRLMQLCPLVFGCGGSIDSMFASTSRKWGNGAMSTPAMHILQNRIANPLIILDELEKVSTGRHNGALVDVLLGMLEPRTAMENHDQYLMAPVNLSGINWLATVNTLDGVPQPLRDRFRILRFPQPAAAHLPSLANSLLTDIMTARGYDARWIKPLAQDELAALAAHWPSPNGSASIRALKRLVEAVADARDRSTTPH